MGKEEQVYNEPIEKVRPYVTRRLLSLIDVGDHNGAIVEAEGFTGVAISGIDSVERVPEGVLVSFKGGGSIIYTEKY